MFRNGNAPSECPNTSGLLKSSAFITMPTSGYLMNECQSFSPFVCRVNNNSKWLILLLAIGFNVSS